MPQQTASLINATLTVWPSPVIGAFTVQQNEAGELVLNGIYKGTQVSQTLPVDLPCLLFIDTVSTNFIPVQDIRLARPEWELYGALKQITV